MPRFKVGDKVKFNVDIDGEHDTDVSPIGATGRIIAIETDDDDSLPYQVYFTSDDFDEDDAEWFSDDELVRPDGSSPVAENPTHVITYKDYSDDMTKTREVYSPETPGEVARELIKNDATRIEVYTVTDKKVVSIEKTMVMK